MIIFVLISLRNLLIHTLKLKDNQKNIHFLLINVLCSHVVMISSCQKCKTLAWLLFLQHASHHITTEECSAEHLLASAHQNSLQVQNKFWQRLTSTCSAEHSSLGCVQHASPYCTNLFFFYLRESGTTIHMKTFLMSLSSFPRQFNCEILVLK